MCLAEWKAVGYKLGSQTGLSAAEFGVVAPPQGQPGTGVKALPCVGAAAGPPARGTCQSSSWKLEAFHMEWGSCSFLKTRRDAVPIPELPHLQYLECRGKLGRVVLHQEFPCMGFQQLQQCPAAPVPCLKQLPLLLFPFVCHNCSSAEKVHPVPLLPWCLWFTAGITLGSLTLQHWPAFGVGMGNNPKIDQGSFFAGVLRSAKHKEVPGAWEANSIPCVVLWCWVVEVMEVKEEMLQSGFYTCHFIAETFLWK